MLIFKRFYKYISPRVYTWWIDLRLVHISIFIVFFFPFLNNKIFYLGFLSQPFTNQRTVEEGGGNFFNSSPQLPPASQTLRH